MSKCLLCDGATRLRICICCNDPDNGNSLGRTSAIEFSNGDAFRVELEGPEIVADYRERGGKRYLQLGRFKRPVLGYKAWFGNWCWDSVIVTREVGRYAFRGLLQRGFRVTDGPEEIYQKTAVEITRELWEKVQCPECHGRHSGDANRQVSA